MNGDSTPEVINSPHPIVEIYYTPPNQWTDFKEIECTVKDIKDPRNIAASILDKLYHCTSQYFGHLKEESFEAYSMVDPVIVDMFRSNKLESRLKYSVVTYLDSKSCSFRSITDRINNGFRPLFKDYELFMIEKVLVDTTLRKEYFELPFLLGLQRSIYIWLLSLCNHFEHKGSLPVRVYWATSKPSKLVYKLYSAIVDIDFDFTESLRYSTSITGHFLDLSLSTPRDFTKQIVEKREFRDNAEFYEHFKVARLNMVHAAIKAKITKSMQLYCTDEELVE